MIEKNIKAKPDWKAILRIITNILLGFGVAFFVAVFSLYAINMIYSRSAWQIAALPIFMIVLMLLPFIFHTTLKRLLSKFYIPLKLLLTAGLLVFAVSFSIFYNFVDNYSKVTVEAFTQTNEDEKIAVFVFGCRVYENGPSGMLQIRLDKAKEILDKYPQAICIVSGGQGIDEHAPEAVVMRDYLVSRGIDKERIYLEEKAKSTHENIIYTLELIEEMSLEGYRLVGVSSDFHIPRIELYADHEDMNITMIPSQSYVRWSMMGNVLREYLAYCKALLFDLS